MREQRWRSGTLQEYRCAARLIPARSSALGAKVLTLYPIPRCFYRVLHVAAQQLRHNTVSTMSSGTVKFFNTEKGFGFITPDEGGKDVFVHKTGTRDNIQEGDKVTFEVEQGPKGRNAVNVTRS